MLGIVYLLRSGDLLSGIDYTHDGKKIFIFFGFWGGRSRQDIGSLDMLCR